MSLTGLAKEQAAEAGVADEDEDEDEGFDYAQEEADIVAAFPLAERPDGELTEVRPVRIKANLDV